MNKAMQNMFLATALAALAASGFAQQSGIASDPKSPTTQQTVRERKPNHAPIAIAGEAANLERTETGSVEEQNTRDDDRDRQTTANRAQPQRPQNRAPSAADRGQHRAAANTNPQGESGRSARKPPEHAAALKTGAWTTGEATLLQAKETSLTQEVVSDRQESGDSTTVKRAQTKPRPNPAPRPRKQKPTIPPQ